MESLPADFFVKSMQFTKHVSRDQYPSIDPTTPALSMANKVVIITGASQGIGAKGFAPAFAKAGAKAIVLVARNSERLRQVATELAQLRPPHEHTAVETLPVSADISDPAQVSALFAKVRAAYGHADVLVNNAGIQTTEGPLGSVDPEAWWKDFSVNTRGTFLMTSHFLKSLPPPSQKEGDSSSSHSYTIINLTSGMGWGIYPGSSAYALSKMINLQMAAYVAAEQLTTTTTTKKDGSGNVVTSVALHPGIVETGMTLDSFRKFALDAPALVGGVAVWLATDKARFMNGRVMNSNWDVDDLYERREEIVRGKLLQIGLMGRFGAEQFEE